MLVPISHLVHFYTVLKTDQIFAAIEQRRKLLGLSQAQVGKLAFDRADTSPIQNIKRGSSPSVDKLAAIGEALGLELYFGLPRNSGQEIVTAIASEDFIPITVHTAEASAGPGLLNPEDDRIGTLAFKRTWLAQIGLNPAKASILRVKGDSMEPTVKDGAIVLIDEQKTKPEKNHIYAFIEDGELRIKRLDVIEGKVLTISSDNKAYPPEARINSDMNKLRILGRVVWTGYNLCDE